MADSPSDMSSAVSEHNFLEHMIDNVFPLREVHLIGGASGAGKTTFLFDLIATWQKGETWFGHQCHPYPFAYIIYDRSMAGIKRVFHRMHKRFEQFGGRVLHVSGPNRNLSIYTLIKNFAKTYPEVRVFFIEGFQSKVEAQKGVQGLNSDAAVAAYLTELTDLCAELNITIIGVAHTSKVKKDDMYIDPRQRIKGSGAWAAYAETIIIIEAEDPMLKNSPRKLMILPRNAAEQHFRMGFVDGLLVEINPAPAPKPKASIPTAVKYDA